METKMESGLTFIQKGASIQTIISDPDREHTFLILISACEELDLKKLKTVFTQDVIIRKENGSRIRGIYKVMEFYSVCFDVIRLAMKGDHKVRIVSPPNINDKKGFYLSIENKSNNDALFIFHMKFKGNRIYSIGDIYFALAEK